MYQQDFMAEVASNMRLRNGLNLNMGSTPSEGPETQSHSRDGTTPFSYPALQQG